ncbi:MAG: polyprenyl synthetase family protein [Proteobacteria bacterium]|nr:polyprenyl synthetase family protein [Pseudomonadota bacterium]
MAAIIPLETPRRKATNALEQLTALVQDDLQAVNEVVLTRMQSSVPLIPQLAGYLIAAGGKRLRPILTLACARLCGYEGARHRKLAACIEFIHTATLLHDDVVDESELRRGSPSANTLFGNKATVLVGDFLFSRSFQLISEDGSPEVLRILSDACAVLAEGEVLQLTTSYNVQISEQGYLEVIRAKTADLFAAACRLGTVVAERPVAEEEALRTYGLNLGLAFQIIDDVLDYSAEQAQLGKTIGDDFREGKITLPVILAYNRSNELERQFFRRVLQDHQQKDGDLQQAIIILSRTGALKDAAERARHYGAIARDALGLFKPHPVKDALLDVIDFTLEREY